MSAVEQSIAISGVEIKTHYGLLKTYCPLEQGLCVGEKCMFSYGNGCIIAQSLTKLYLSGVLGRD